MKKLVLAVFALCIAWPAFSQTSIRFGIKAGGNLSFSKMTVDHISVNSDAKLGFYGGGLMEVSPGYADNKFKVQLEALYNQGNIEFQLPGSQGFTDKLKVNQIQIPLLAKYFIFPELSVNLGPTFNLNLNGKESEYSDSLGLVQQQDLGSDDLNTFQMGLAAGATYYIYKGLFIDARYSPIFGQLNKAAEGDYNGKIKQNYLQLGIGYKF